MTLADFFRKSAERASKNLCKNLSEGASKRLPPPDPVRVKEMGPLIALQAYARRSFIMRKRIISGVLRGQKLDRSAIVSNIPNF